MFFICEPSKHLLKLKFIIEISFKGFILADKGYDVWLGNSRGNVYSMKHTSRSAHSIFPSERKLYWSFSWHEIGVYDLPASIDYILGKTGAKKLQYIGHSQGTTAFFVMASERPEYNDKIEMMHALAPVAYLTNVFSPIIKVLTPLKNALEVCILNFKFYILHFIFNLKSQIFLENGFDNWFTFYPTNPFVFVVRWIFTNSNCFQKLTLFDYRL